MRGEFDQPDLEPKRRDAELTLSPTTALGLFIGGILVCALFFGLGFAVGRWGPSDSSSASVQQKVQTALATANKPKPSALPQAASNEPDHTPQSYAPPAATAPSAVQPLWPTAQSVVKPALPGQPATQPPFKPSEGFLMVQIAAVAHEEDAAVLVSALRKRSYAVAVRRAADDNLLHIQIGPFATRYEANAMRNKLLDDGYNAIVQP